MIEQPVCPNPECRSPHTKRNHGMLRFGSWMFQQRHVCLECGQKFLTLWQGEMLRTYESREPVKKKKRKDTGQMNLPGMG